MVRVVIDTSVIISALLQPEGTSFKAFLKAANHFKPLLSFETYAELVRVFEKPKFKSKISNETKSLFLKIVLDKSERISVTSSFKICRDSNDDMFLNLAIDGKAGIIISRDPDLLILNSFQNILIMNPSEFILMEK